MIKSFYLAMAMAAATTAASAANVVFQQDFTPAEVGTLPAGVSASYDGGSDVSVVPYGTMQPTIAADHPGGDGHVLRVGDINTGGGAYNFAFPTTPLAVGDGAIEAWVYVTSASLDAAPLQERDYFLMFRLQNTNPSVTGTAAGIRNAYTFAISYNASFGGITPNPVNGVPFIFKRVAAVQTQIGNSAAAAIVDGWHLLKLQASGSTITAYVDNVVVCSGTDSAASFPSGSAALGYYEKNGGATYPLAGAYDNWKVSSIPASVNEWSIY